MAYFGSKRITAGKKDWDKTFSVNNDVVDYSQACHPFMKEMEVADKIHCAAKSYIGCTPAASKGATLAMTRCMALDLSADGIRVNSVSPTCMGVSA